MGPISKVTLVNLTHVQKKKHRNTFYTTNKTLSIVSIQNHDVIQEKTISFSLYLGSKH
jgi:hypothetical protein